MKKFGWLNAIRERNERREHALKDMSFFHRLDDDWDRFSFLCSLDCLELASLLELALKDRFIRCSVRPYVLHHVVDDRHVDEWVISGQMKLKGQWFDILSFPGQKTVPETDPIRPVRTRRELILLFSDEFDGVSPQGSTVLFGEDLVRLFDSSFRNVEAMIREVESVQGIV